MGTLLAFAPFFVFVILEKTIGVTVGLAAAAIVAAIKFTSWYPDSNKAKTS